MLTEKEKRFLLEAARNAITAHPEKAYPEKLHTHHTSTDRLPPALMERKGVFVSLHLDGELRGCVGNILPEKRLSQAVVESVINAAYHDQRFCKPTKDELRRMEIEISVLTDPVKVNAIDGEQLLRKLGSDTGIVIRKGLCTATFLPQVWEQLAGKEGFMAHLCLKAGLSPDSWRESDTEVYFYTVERFKSAAGSAPATPAMGFKEKVWQLCRKVPKGKVTTYKFLAEAAGTKAYRAVGNAMNKNPYSPIVPCHRVVGSDGSLVGFAHGLKKKAELLRKEGIKVKNNKIVDFEKVIYRF